MSDKPHEAPIPPALLLIDWTAMGGGAASGELKSTYFQNWPEQKFAHLYAGPSEGFGFRTGNDSEILESSSEILRRVREFSPDTILYRPVADREYFHAAAVEVIKAMELPYSIWLMDDWPERLRSFDPKRFAEIDPELRNLLKYSSLNFAISELMAEAFSVRYGVTFEVLRNGVRLEDWEHLSPPPPRNEIVVRYAGSLAEDTTRSSVELVAKAVDFLSVKLKIRFEIRTQRHWLNREIERFKQFQSTTIAETVVGIAEYRTWLAGADVLLIGYNFDPDTRRYLQFSFANKIPECLASGAPVLLVGPEYLSSVSLLIKSNAVEYVSSHNVQAVAQALERLAENPDLRKELGERGRKFAFSTFDLIAQQKLLLNGLSAIATKQSKSNSPALQIPVHRGEFPFPCCGRESGIQLNEPQLLARLLNAHHNTGFMVDVGTHHGGSLAPFFQCNWRILGFEPDPRNRRILLDSFKGDAPQFEIVSAAVGDREVDAVPIYASKESSGISGLSAFRPSHVEVCKVPLVTLNSELSKRNITQVEFLKIDVEGHEMQVLRGLDFGQVKPSVVMIEYEDSKTDSHDYDAHDLAQILMDHGYTVYVSEWWPIVKYGARHSWRQFKKYPCTISSEGWGNLIGFTTPPETYRLAKSLEESLQHPPTPCGNVPDPNDRPRSKDSDDSPLAPSTNQSKTIELPKVSTNEFTETATSPSTPAITGEMTFSRWAKGYVGRNILSTVVVALLFAGLGFAAQSVPEYSMLVSFAAIIIACGVGMVSTIDYGRYLFKRNRSAFYEEIGNVRREFLSRFQTSEVNAKARADDFLRQIHSLKQGLETTVSSANAEIQASVARKFDRLNERQAKERAKSEITRNRLEEAFESITVTRNQLRNETAKRLTDTAAAIELVSQSVEALASSLREEKASVGHAIAEQQKRADVSIQSLGDRIEKERFSYLKGLQELAAKTETTRERIESLNSLLESAQGNIADLIAKVQEAKVIDESLAASLAELRTSSAALYGRFHHMNGSNSARVRPHRRFVETSELKNLSEVWAPRLGLTITERSLAYLAHQICILEDKAAGRLATTVTAALVRVIALRSLAGNTVDVLEIGTLFGVGAGILYRHGSETERQVRLTLVDPLDGYYGKGALDPQTGVPISRKVLEQNLYEMGVKKSDYRIIQAFSGDGTSVNQVGQQTYDYVLLDGDHSRDGVAKDFELFGPKVKIGGLLVFDDYDTTDWPAIKEFVDSELMNHPSWQFVGSGWRTAIFRSCATKSAT